MMAAAPQTARWGLRAGAPTGSSPGSERSASSCSSGGAYEDELVIARRLLDEVERDDRNGCSPTGMGWTWWWRWHSDGPASSSTRSATRHWPAWRHSKRTTPRR